jgi:hypothetical protein
MEQRVLDQFLDPDLADALDVFTPDPLGDGAGVYAPTAGTGGWVAPGAEPCAACRAARRALRERALARV